MVQKVQKVLQCLKYSSYCKYSSYSGCVCILFSVHLPTNVFLFFFFVAFFSFLDTREITKNAPTRQIFRLDGASAISQTVTRFSLDTRHVCRFHPAGRNLRCRQDRLHPHPEGPCSDQDRVWVQADTMKHQLHQV